MIRVSMPRGRRPPDERVYWHDRPIEGRPPPAMSTLERIFMAITVILLIAIGSLFIAIDRGWINQGVSH